MEEDNVRVRLASMEDIEDVVASLNPAKDDPECPNDLDVCMEFATDMLTGDEDVYIATVNETTIGTISIADYSCDNTLSGSIYIKDGFEEYQSKMIEHIEWQAIAHQFNAVSLIIDTLEEEKLLKSKGYSEEKYFPLPDFYDPDIKEFRKQLKTKNFLYK